MTARWWNAPNLLTAARAALAPLVVWEIVLRHAQLALVLLAIAAVTDLLDGWLARSTGSATSVGQLLDPAADKLLLSGVFFALAYTHAVPIWFVALVFGRDVYLLIASGILVRINGKTRNLQILRPSLAGKLSTVFQLAAAALCMLKAAFPTRAEADLPRSICNAALWLAALFTLLSGVHYTWRGVRYLNRVDDRFPGE